MRNLKAIILCALLVLQTTTFIVKDLPSVVPDLQSGTQNIKKQAVSGLGNQLRDNAQIIGYDNPIARAVADPNMAWGWHGQLKIVKYMAGITIDVDLKSNLGHEELTFTGAGAGTFPKAKYEGHVYAGFIVKPDELFGKDDFALSYESKEVTDIGTVKGIVVGISKVSDPK